MRGRWLRGAVLAAALAAAALVPAAGARAATPAQQPAAPAQPTGGLQQLPGKRDAPVLINADQITYDQQLGIVVASGNVEVAQGDQVLHADNLGYNQKTKVVTASGHVSLLDPSGNVAFADYMELTDDLKEGVIRDIKVLLSDRSRLAANSAVRTSGNHTVFTRGVFSPCALCATDPMRPPLWQITARKAIRDEEAQRISYEDAWLEIYGVPIAYLPVFSHPDVGAKRQSGFLPASFGRSTQLGFVVQPVYYWATSDSSDITLSPIITTKKGAVFDGQYRQRFVDGYFQADGSATYTSRNDDASGGEKVMRGHLFAAGRYDIDENWRSGLDVNFASDKDYLRLYNFTSARTLTTRAFAEGFYGRSYALAESMWFQGTRDQDNNKQSPIVAPALSYSYVGEPGRYGSYLTFDASTAVLTRISGRDDRRISLQGGWTLPYTSPAGDVYTLTASLRGDLYSINGQDPNHPNTVNPSDPSFDGWKARIFPQLTGEWRYPFARHHETWDEVLQPVVGFAVGTGGMNSKKIPNEDSLDIEFDETNLFNANRFAGYDVIDGGQRVNYGLEYSVFTKSGGFGSIFVGQTYQHGASDVFRNGSGLSNNLTDIVGKVEISPNQYLDLLWRWRVDPFAGKLDRNEATLTAGPRLFNVSLTYAYLRGGATGEEFGNREEVAGTVRSQITDYWAVLASGRRDLSKGNWLSYGGGIVYSDECFDFAATAERSNFKDNENKPGTSFLIRFGFKYLGAFGTSF
ncbi:MAG: LPS assembly protein LptD [Dongiaceae bacterium]